MPSSRKKSKGKERKAKAGLKGGCGWRALASCGDCNHGCPELPPKNHPVALFMDLVDVETQKLSSKEFAYAVPLFLPRSFEVHSAVWNEEDNRNIALKILASIGTNTILRGSATFETSIVFAMKLMELRHETERRWEKDGTPPNVGAALETSMTFVRKLVDGGSRELLSFYSKRVPCHCLDELYANAKASQRKVARCDGCAQTKDRTSFMKCSRCNMAQFCSRECFVAAWPVHKVACDFACNSKKACDKRFGTKNGFRV